MLSPAGSHSIAIDKPEANGGVTQLSLGLRSGPIGSSSLSGGMQVCSGHSVRLLAPSLSPGFRLKKQKMIEAIIQGKNPKPESFS